MIFFNFSILATGTCACRMSADVPTVITF